MFPFVNQLLSGRFLCHSWVCGFRQKKTGRKCPPPHGRCLSSEWSCPSALQTPRTTHGALRNVLRKGGRVAAGSRESLFQWTRSSEISLESGPGRPGRRPLAVLGSLAWSAVLPCPCRGRGLPPARQVLALTRPRTVHSHSSVGRTTPWGRVKMWPLSLRSSECNRGRRVTTWQPRCHHSKCCSGGTGKHPREHHAAPP